MKKFALVLFLAASGCKGVPVEDVRVITDAMKPHLEYLGEMYQIDPRRSEEQKKVDALKVEALGVAVEGIEEQYLSER